jgi:hypothetical protein
MRPALVAALLSCVLLSIGCEDRCAADGADGLAGFELDCAALEFRIDAVATRIALAEVGGGQITLEMTPVHTLSRGTRFETGGEFDVGGNHVDADGAIAPVDDAWIEITAWEATDGEAHGQLVAFDFHVEVGSTSRFAGGELDGDAASVPVYSSE